MKEIKNKFKTHHICIGVRRDDKIYDSVVSKFNKHGFAFMREDKVIFFDVDRLKDNGYYNDTVLTFIQAHEIAHSVLKHTKYNPHVEAEADYLGILLCKDSGYNKSAKLGQSEFRTRNKISFEKFEKKYKTDILKRL